MKEEHSNSGANKDPDMTFTLTLSAPVDVDVKVDIATTNGGEATTTDNDFTAVGATTKTFNATAAGGTPNQPTQIVVITSDDVDERGGGHLDSETLQAALSSLVAGGRNVSLGAVTPGQITNDDFDTEIVSHTDTNDPSEHGENFDISWTVQVVNVASASNPAVPATAGKLREDEIGGAAAQFGATQAAPNFTATDSLAGTLRDATMRASYAGEMNALGNNHNPSQHDIMHVVNNIPTFALRTGPITVNGQATGYNGQNLTVQSDSAGTKAFTISDYTEQTNADRHDGAANDNTEEGQTVSFTVTVTEVNGGAVTPMNNPFTMAGQPAIADSAGAGFANQNLTFTTKPGAAAIVTLEVTATDDGEDLAGNGAQISAAQEFCISVYGVQPFAGDLLIADRGSRVYTGELLLVHTNAGSMTYPTQNMIDDTLVDAYEVAIRTNSTALPGKSFLEYVVLDYETIVSAKGRGRQGLFGVNAVSQGRRTISTGQFFQVPLALDLLPFDSGANAGNLAIADAEYEPALSKIILVDPAQPDGANQTLLTQGGELFFTTGLTVGPEGAPAGVAGQIFVTDVGNVFGKTVNKNDNPRKIVKVDPTTGAQTLLVSEINDFTIPITNGMITNLYHPTGIDVDRTTGDLYVADSFSKTIWKLAHMGGGAYAAALEAVSLDADFLQPVHLTVDQTGAFLYVTDGATIAPGAAYAAGTRLLHRVTLGADPLTNSDVFSQDGFFKEPRGIELIPIDPLTGN